MSEQLNYMSGQFCSCSDILSQHLLLLIKNPAIKTHHYNSDAELMRLQQVIKCEVSTPICKCNLWCRTLLPHTITITEVDI